MERSKNKRREESGMPSLGSAFERTIADPVVLQASAFGASDVRVRPPRLCVGVEAPASVGQAAVDQSLTSFVNRLHGDA